MITPARQQYLRLKAQHPDAILLYRLGDFYEAFDEDAHTISQVLGITLTSRSFGRAGRVPMAGIPHHALNGYLRRLLRSGLRIAIGEQMTEAGHGLVEREIVRVLSPGTLDDPGLLDASRPNYLLALAAHGTLIGMAWVDVSTGACEHHALPADDPAAIMALVNQLAPAEIVAPEGLELDLDDLPSIRGVPAALDYDAAGAEFIARFPTADVPRPAPLLAFHILIGYLVRGHADLVAAVESPLPYAAGRIMMLDRQTRANLELDLRTRGAPDLFSLLNATRTAPGARLLRLWLQRPLLDRREIEDRLDAVASLAGDAPLRMQLSQHLNGVRDLERLATRARTGAIRSQELLALAESLRHSGDVRDLLVRRTNPPALAEAVQRINDMRDLRERINGTLADDGRLVRQGRDLRLDGLYEALDRERTGIVELERRERERTGIRSLRSGYNKVFGYYFEISKANRHLAPADADRKQSLTNAERYVTPELSAAEVRVNALDGQVAGREAEVYAVLVSDIAAELSQLRSTAAGIAHIDALNALASVAVEHRYTRPVIHDDNGLAISGGRHAIVERELSHGMFVPNDTLLNDSAGRVVVLTGPNMAGKSTWLRQTALIVLMAQLGSFVPAESAEIGLVDRIFTRIGAHDDLARGRSTFMVEMLETATILQNATERSLVVLDEVGRGTSTEDGVAIARAVVEHLARETGARTLFATHFRELAHACVAIPTTRAMQTAVARNGDEIVFLHTIVPGIADAALGLEIARLAGIPSSVIERAREVAPLDYRPLPPHGETSVTAEILVNERVARELLAIDIAGTTPLEALVALAEMQARLRACKAEPLGPRMLAAETAQAFGRAD